MGGSRSDRSDRFLENHFKLVDGSCQMAMRMMNGYPLLGRMMRVEPLRSEQRRGGSGNGVRNPAAFFPQHPRQNVQNFGNYHSSSMTAHLPSSQYSQARQHDSQSVYPTHNSRENYQSKPSNVGPEPYRNPAGNDIMVAIHTLDKLTSHLKEIRDRESNGIRGQQKE
jgi:RNA recognition motif-containing protein